MASFLSAYNGFLKIVTKIVGIIAGILVLVCGLMIVYEVICRSVFNAPTQWVMELSTYCVTIAGFLGMGVAYAGKKHIHVDVILSKLSNKVKVYLSVITTLAGAFYALMFTLQGIKMVQLSILMNNTSPTTLSTPLWIPQSSMPIGMALLFLHLVYSFLESIYKIATGNFEEEGK